MNVSEFFATERYVRTRFLFLILVGILFLTAVVFAFMYLHIPQRALALVICLWAACVWTATLFILRNAQATATASGFGSSDALLDDAIRRKLRGRIRSMQFGVVFLALVFVCALWETRDDPLLPRLVGASMNLLFQFALIGESIRKLQKLLK